MRTISRFVAICFWMTFLLIPILAQERDLPEYGEIADIKDLQKVYVIADLSDSRYLILKELKKYPGLVVVNSPREAEFFLEYEVISVYKGDYYPVTLSEMVVYILKDKTRKIVWSENEDQEGLSAPNEVNLSKHFIKALKIARGEITR